MNGFSVNQITYFAKKKFNAFQPDETPEPSDGDLPKCDSTYSIDIPHSELIWEAEPRPPNTAEVKYPFIIEINFIIEFYYKHFELPVLSVHLVCDDTE